VALILSTIESRDFAFLEFLLLLQLHRVEVLERVIHAPTKDLNLILRFEQTWKVILFLSILNLRGIIFVQNYEVVQNANVS
jgi:hypothetical protein